MLRSSSAPTDSVGTLEPFRSSTPSRLIPAPIALSERELIRTEAIRDCANIVGEAIADCDMYSQGMNLADLPQAAADYRDKIITLGVVLRRIMLLREQILQGATPTPIPIHN